MGSGTRERDGGVGRWLGDDGGWSSGWDVDGGGGWCHSDDAGDLSWDASGDRDGGEDWCRAGSWGAGRR